MKKFAILATAAVAAIVAAAPAAATNYTVAVGPIATLPAYPSPVPSPQVVTGVDNNVAIYYQFQLLVPVADLTATFQSNKPGLQFSSLVLYTGTYNGTGVAPGTTPLPAYDAGSNPTSNPVGSSSTQVGFSDKIITGGLGDGFYTLAVFGSMPTAASTAVTASIQFTQTAVPEAATWAMMLVGFGAVGGALRSTRRKVSFA